MAAGEVITRTAAGPDDHDDHHHAYGGGDDSAEQHQDLRPVGGSGWSTGAASWP
jgi:hypothetical protein